MIFLGFYTVSVVIGFFVYRRESEVKENALARKLRTAIEENQEIVHLRATVGRLNSLVTDHESKFTAMDLKAGFKRG